MNTCDEYSEALAIFGQDRKNNSEMKWKGSGVSGSRRIDVGCGYLDHILTEYSDYIMMYEG